MLLLNKNILLGVTGSIAAYKSAQLLRELQELGAKVRVIMTRGASEFVTPLTLHALSGHKVYQQNLEQTDAMVHIELARWADLIVIAPASADCIANLALGRANTLLSAMCLASQVPLAVAPAMNQAMWAHCATQSHINTLTNRGVHILEPDTGIQACGEVGAGRMQEPEVIATNLSKLFATGALAGTRVVITAGPTHEYLDPVRYLANASSGKMGFALAAAALEAGAQTCLIAGPVNLETPKGAARIDVVSAAQMHAAVQEQHEKMDIFIAVAAVADYRAHDVQQHKMSKQPNLQLELAANEDILASVAQDNTIFSVGFAAQSHDLEKYALQKLEHKQLDMLIANDISRSDIGFASDDNQVILFYSKEYAKEKIALAKQSKHKLARTLIELISQQYCQ